MKKLIAVLMLLSVSSALVAEERELAEDRDPASKAFWTESQPSASCMPAKPKPRKRVKRAVVKPTAPKEVIVEKTVEKQVVVEKAVEVEAFKNRVKLLGGAGPYPSGIIEKLPTSVSLSTHYLPVVGAGYERLLNKRWSLEGQIYTNGTWALGVGYGF